MTITSKPATDQYRAGWDAIDWQDDGGTETDSVPRVYQCGHPMNSRGPTQAPCLLCHAWVCADCYPGHKCEPIQADYDE